MTEPVESSSDSRSVSFLVRLWKEPQDGASTAVRGYLRNLQSGEQHYLGDPEELGAFLVRQAHARLDERASEENSTATESR